MNCKNGFGIHRKSTAIQILICLIMAQYGYSDLAYIDTVVLSSHSENTCYGYFERCEYSPQPSWDENTFYYIGDVVEYFGNIYGFFVPFKLQKACRKLPDILKKYSNCT